MPQGQARSLAIALAVMLGAIAPVLSAPAIACAAAPHGPHAALVVDTGVRATAYCVALDGASVSGTHLIELASDQYGFTYRLGFGGRAVCMLAGVGATGDDCFGSYPNFWGYFHGAGASGWTWASGSAADQPVGDGDREAWSWGAGDSATTHGVPPSTTIGDACGTATAPEPSPSASTSPSPTQAPPSPSSVGGSSNGGGSNAAGEGGGQASEHTKTPEPPAASSPTAAAPTSASPTVVRAAAASPPDSSGPPLAGLVALGAIVLLGAGGVATMRRRRVTR